MKLQMLFWSLFAAVAGVAGTHNTAEGLERRKVYPGTFGLLTYRDQSSLKQWCMSVIPLTDSNTLELSLPWQQGRKTADGKFVPSTTYLRGKVFVNGIEVVGGIILLTFDGEGRLVSGTFPIFPRDFLAQDPGKPRVSSEEAKTLVIDALLQKEASGYDIRVSPAVYSVENKRYIVPVRYIPRWDLSAPYWRREYWTTQWVNIDAQTGEIVARGEHILQTLISGRVRGVAGPLTGLGVRRAHAPDNPGVEEYLPFIPLEVIQQNVPRTEPIFTDSAGNFHFETLADGEWAVQTNFDTWHYTVVSSPHTQRIVGQVTGAADNRETDLFLNSEPTDDIIGENKVGFLTTWLYLKKSRELFDILADRNIDWPRGVGDGKAVENWIEGFPAWLNIELVILPSEDGTIPLGGAYLDAFPPRRAIGISEANLTFHHWGAPAVRHESGHSGISALTGKVNYGFPNLHDGYVEEGFADFWDVFVQEYMDAESEVPNTLLGCIGCGKERGFPASFHRNIARADGCHSDIDPLTPCTIDTGHELYPDVSELHLGSLYFSGFLFDVWQSFVVKYGRREGFWRMGDLIIRWIDKHRGQFMPAFDRYAVYDVLEVNDSEYFGGDDIPWNGSPDFDIIVNAAARHNLWLRSFVRGDVTSDRELNLSDAVYLLNYLFIGGSEPGCLDAADADDSGVVNLSDAVGILAVLFLGKTPLPRPLDCTQVDVTPNDKLTCASYTGCAPLGG